MLHRKSHMLRRRTILNSDLQLQFDDAHAWTSWTRVWVCLILCVQDMQSLGFRPRNDLQNLASAGAYGVHESNIERDVMRRSFEGTAAWYYQSGTLLRSWHQSMQSHLQTRCPSTMCRSLFAPATSRPSNGAQKPGKLCLILYCLIFCIILHSIANISTIY